MTSFYTPPLHPPPPPMRPPPVNYIIAERISVKAQESRELDAKVEAEKRGACLHIHHEVAFKPRHNHCPPRFLVCVTAVCEYAWSRCWRAVDLETRRVTIILNNRYYDGEGVHMIGKHPWTNAKCLLVYLLHTPYSVLRMKTPGKNTTQTRPSGTSPATNS